MSAENKAPAGGQPSATPPEPNRGGRASAEGSPSSDQAGGGEPAASRRRRGNRGGRRRRKPAEPQATATAGAERRDGRAGPSTACGRTTASLERLPTAPLIPIASAATVPSADVPPRGKTGSRSRRPAATEPPAAGFHRDSTGAGALLAQATLDAAAPAGVR